MKKYSQRELLSEGIWGGIKAAAKGVGKGLVGAAKLGHYALGKVAPEVQSLYRDPIKAVGGAIHYVRKPMDTSSVLGTNKATERKQITQQTINSIKRGLLNQGYKLSFKPIAYQSYDQTNKRDIYAATVVDPTTKRETRYYVDVKGNIVQ